MKQNERGYAVVWVLVVIALIAAVISSIEFTVDTRPPWVGMYWVFGFSILVAGFGLLIEAKRDLYAFCMFVTVFAFVTAIITGAVWAYGTEPHPVAATIAILATLAVVVCVIYMLKTQYGREVLPNLLRREYPRSAIYEVDGVQFVTTYGPKSLTAGECFEVKVVVQNCWDTPRTFQLGLSTEMRVSLTKAGLVYEREPKVVVPGAVVKMLRIPVAVHPNAKGRYSLLADPRVSGSGGVRVRRWRTQGLNSRISPWLTAIGSFFGFLVWGGGMKFKVEVRGNKQAGETESDVPKPTEEIVWSPEPHMLDAAVRAA